MVAVSCYHFIPPLKSILSWRYGREASARMSAISSLRITWSFDIEKTRAGNVRHSPGRTMQGRE